MKFHFLLLTSILLQMNFAHAAEGGNVGNGGGGLVCADGKVYLYDLFEATIPGEHTNAGLKIVRDDNDTAEAQIQLALAKVEAGFSVDMRIALEARLAAANKALTFIPSETEIAPPTDVDGEFMKKGCTLAGVASYNDSKERLLLDRSLYDRMPSTDQAALWMHEIVYRFLRDHEHVTDSRKARRFVSVLFSNVPTDQYSKYLPTNLTQFQAAKFVFDPKGSVLNLSVNTANSRSYFVRGIAECSGSEKPTVVLFEGNNRNSLNATGGGFHNLEVPLIVKDNTTDEKRFSAAIALSNCKAILGYYDSYLRFVGASSFLFTEDALRTEKYLTGAKFYSTDWDYF